jgi:hypothetical protein
MDAIVRIDPKVLAAALLDVEGVSLDPSDEDGAKDAAQRVERLMSDTRTEKQLLDAIERHTDSALINDDPFPSEYSQVGTIPSTQAHNSALDVPPIGSAEFEAYMAAPDDRKNIVAKEVEINFPLASPSELGFPSEATEEIEPLPSYEVDAVVREAQRVFERRQLKQSFRERFRVAVDALRNRLSPNWVSMITPMVARNRYVVDVRRLDAHWHWDSVLVGRHLYVVMSAEGRQALRMRLPLSDSAATTRRLETVFADEPTAGAETLRALRIAMIGSAAAARGPMRKFADGVTGLDAR